MLQVTDIVDQLGPSVAGVRWGGRRGSGVVVAQDRVVVLRRSNAGPIEVALAGQQPREGELVGSDRRRAIAVVVVPTGDAAAPAWADGAAGIGDAVFALANPGATGLRATEGRVSSEPLTVRGRHGRAVEGVIEHTAPLPRGAGGGPLVDAAGALLGLNVLRADPGFLLALPAAVVRPAVERILAGREEEGGRLGVALVPARASRRMRAAVGLPERDGLLVRGVEDGGPAELAGVRAGDLLIGLGGTDLHGVEDVFAALDAAENAVELRLIRGTEELDVSVALSTTEAG
jgi:serine protease Do